MAAAKPLSPIQQEAYEIKKMFANIESQQKTIQNNQEKLQRQTNQNYINLYTGKIRNTRVKLDATLNAVRLKLMLFADRNNMNNTMRKFHKKYSNDYKTIANIIKMKHINTPAHKLPKTRKIITKTKKNNYQKLRKIK